MTGTTVSLLTPIIVMEAVVLATAIVVLMAHAVWRKAHERRRAARHDRGRPLFADALLSATDERLVNWLLAQPMSHRLELCSEYAATVHGHALERLEAVARRVGVTAYAEACCGSRRWRRRLRGARALTALAHHQAVPGLARTLVNDAHPLVRAQAIEWLSRGSTASTAALVVDRMADPAALVRFAAQDAVRNAGEAAVEPLLRFLRTRSGPECHGALNAVRGLASPALLPSVLALTKDPCAETRALATATLGALGGADGISQLQRGLGDAAPAVRAAATHAIGQLGHWPAAPDVAALLEDAHFGVRREAASALRRLGAPGMLLLRRAASRPEGAAAGIAKHVMSLPDPVFRDRAAA